MSILINSVYGLQVAENKVLGNYESVYNDLSDYFSRISKVVERAFKIVNLEAQEPPLTLKQRVSPIAQDSDFLDALFEDLGLTAITESEYAKMKQLLTDIFLEKSKIIKFARNTSTAFRQAVFLDFLILLTRPTSRKLIQELSEKKEYYHNTVIISESESAAANEDEIKLHLKEYATIVTHPPEGDGFFYPGLRFVALAHEMIHVYHYRLYGIRRINILAEWPPSLNVYYHNMAEQYAETGNANGMLPQLDIYEHKISKEFGLKEGNDHLGIYVDFDLPLNTYCTDISMGPHDLDNQFYLIIQAIKMGANLNILTYLENNGDISNVYLTQGDTLLHKAAESLYANAAMIEALINRELKIDSQNFSGLTPIHTAIIHGNKKAAKALLDKKCRLDLQEKYGKLPIHFAIEKGDPEIIEWLIDADPSTLNAQDRYGSTPLHLAIGTRSVNKEIVQLLLMKGCRLDLQNSYQMTPLDIAKNFKNQEIIDLLFHHSNV